MREYYEENKYNKNYKKKEKNKGKFYPPTEMYEVFRFIIMSSLYKIKDEICYRFWSSIILW